MTKKEALREINSNYPYGFSQSNNELINNIYNAFQKQIDKLRQKLLDVDMPIKNYEEIDIMIQEILMSEEDDLKTDTEPF